MATSLEISEKKRSRSSAPKTLSFGENIAEIGPADPETIVLREILKKKEVKNKITEGKIYSRVGRFAKWAK